MKIKDLGDIVTGKTPSTFDEENFGGEICFVTPEDIAKGYMLNFTNRYISEKGYNSLGNNVLLGMSVLVGCIGSDMGNVAMINKKSATNQQINSITNFKEGINPYYVYYLLSLYKEGFRKRAGGTATPILSKELFGEIGINIPDKNTQDKVSKLLSTIDDKIELNNKINSELEAMARELYEYRFVQFDFPDENGKPYKSSGGKMVWNEELKREIPEGWEVKTLGDIIVENKKSPFKVSDAKGSGEYPFFTSGADILLHDEALVDGLNCYLNTGGNGDVKVYNGETAYSGDTWCIKGKNNSTAYLSQILLSFRPRLDIKFFAGTGLQHLQKDLLKMENIVMPHKNILDKFNGDIETITLKIANNKKQNKDLAELRDFLLPMLMNGQVTVK